MTLARRSKGPKRGDIYFGSGDDAGRLAGVTKQPGHLYALLPINDRAVTVPDPKTASDLSVKKQQGPGGHKKGRSRPDDDHAIWQHTAASIEPLKCAKHVFIRQAKR